MTLITCNCGAAWKLEDLLAQEDENSRVEETIAERVCFLCRAEPKEPTILAFRHGSFKIARTVPEWQAIFDGVVNLQECRACKPIEIIPFELGQRERDYIESAKKNSALFQAVSRKDEIAINKLLAEPEEE